ncbi:MAG: GTPase [Methylococcales bacterium]
MGYDFSNLLAKTQQWMQSAATDGWLLDTDASALQAFGMGESKQVFDGEQGKPLVVAFFGGTGVGKSSLLNRLAAEDVAKTGVERPTSREVTLYIHDAIQLGGLPSELPVEQIKVARHNEQQWKDVAWIDMPDIDSVEQNNRHIVEQWLPHVDLLVYVVSPERYRDERGWRFLQSQGAGHGWIFVMNQWDRGDPSQIDDLRKLLASSGFADPVLFRTICKQPIPDTVNDDFEQLVASIKALANRHTLAHLEARNIQVRQQELKNTIEDALARMGNNASAKQLNQGWDNNWQNTTDVLEKGLQWPAKYVAQTFIGRYKGLPAMARLPHESAENSDDNQSSETPILWDAWAQTRFQDAVDEVTLEADHLGFPAEPYRQALLPVSEGARKSMLSHAQQALRQALANPGNLFQRIFLPVFKLLAIVLPLAAGGWIGYRVVDLYYKNGTGELPYLGMDFAIHSGLLLLISWLLPWFVLRNLRPALEKTAVRGIESGVEQGLGQLGLQVEDAIDATVEMHASHIKSAQQLLVLCDEKPELPETGVSDQLLNRILSSKKINSRLHKQNV